MKLRNTLLGLCLILLMGSCSSNKTVLPYFTDLTETHGSVPKGSFELTIVPDDELVINVTAANMEAVEQFNVPYQRTRTNDFNNAGNGIPSLRTLFAMLTALLVCSLSFMML